MADSDIDIIIRSRDEFTQPFSKASQSRNEAVSMLKGSFGALYGLQNDTTGVDKAAQSYKRFTEAVYGAAVNTAALNDSLNQASTDSAVKRAITQEEEIAKLKDFNEQKYQMELDYFLKRIGLASSEYTILEEYRSLHKAGEQAREAVISKAYQSLGQEYLNLIEIHQFSAGAFAKAIAEQVKVELAGIAAKSTIWAIYETAMGLKDLAVGSPTAALHFAAAEQFGTVAVASLAAAAGVQALFGGETSTSSGSSTASSISSGADTAASLTTGSNQAQTTQQITIQIYNPLSEQNWQKIVEDNIIPAIKDASDKNISIDVKNM